MQIRIDFIAEPDPATDQDPVFDPGVRWLENLQLKKFNICFLISRPLKRSSKQHKKSSALKKEHLALENMKFFNFFWGGHFFISWIRIQIQVAKSMRIYADRDPQNCFFNIL